MKISQTNQFKKDLKKQIKRGKDIDLLTSLLELLLNEQPLPERYKDHQLTGNWKNKRDCQIEPDWILIYRKMEDEIRLERTGTHSDLF